MEQRSYFYYQAKLAGWDSGRVSKLLTAKFQTDSFDALSVCEKRQAIVIMKRYAAKEREHKSRQLRRWIMASAFKSGYNYESFHDWMRYHGFGDSLRALDYGKLLELMNLFNHQSKAALNTGSKDV